MVRYEISEHILEDQEEFFSFFPRVLAQEGWEFDAGKHSDLQNIEEEYQTNSGTFLLLRHGGRVVGSIALRRLDKQTVELKRLFIFKEHRGKGWGRILLAKVVSHAVDQGFERIRLDTTSQSERALQLYKKQGFKFIERYNDNPDAELFMELRLDSQ